MERLLTSPVFSPVAQFRLGRKEPFLRALTRYQAQVHWETVFCLCRDCLSDVDDGQPTLLASDWLVWSHFIDAAARLKNVRPE